MLDCGRMGGHVAVAPLPTLQKAYGGQNYQAGMAAPENSS